MVLQEKNRLVQEEGKQVIVLDAAVLLQAHWDSEVHEIWAAFINKDEAVKRIVERDGKTPEQAEARLKSQMSNPDLIARSNVVFCSQWDYDVTRGQVLKAWNRLQNLFECNK